jgi:hypothetical protein
MEISFYQQYGSCLVVTATNMPVTLTINLSKVDKDSIYTPAPAQTVAQFKGSVSKTGDDFEPLMIILICLGAASITAILAGNFFKKKPGKEAK